MTKLLVTATALMVVAGCSSSGRGGEPTSTSAPSSSSGGFLAIVHSAKYQERGGLAAYDDRTLLGAAKRECREFDGLGRRGERSLAASDLIGVGWSAASAAALVDAAATAVC